MTSNQSYDTIASAIDYLRRHPNSGLSELAAYLNLSEGHCHRLFHQWAGITPKQFQRFVQRQHCLQILKRSQSILEASWQAGLSGPGRLHDLIVHWEGMSPGEYKADGMGLTIRYGCHSTPLGWALLAVSERGLCHLSFDDNPTANDFKRLKNRWPKARWLEDPVSTEQIAKSLFPKPTHTAPSTQPSRPPPLHLWGTPFQHKVWEALLNIPRGHLSCYGQIAKAIGAPGAARAVGTAVGANPVALLIPCHRVIRATGDLGQYRWGNNRKAVILAQELAAPLEKEQAWDDPTGT